MNVLSLLYQIVKEHPVDRFSMEVEMVKQYSRFTDKKIMVIHQKDEELAKDI